MKKILLVVATLLSFSAIAQPTEDDKQTTVKSTFSSQSIVTNDTDHNIVILKGEVSFKTDLIHIENAEKVTFNESTQELIAENISAYSFRGTTVVKNNARKKILHYKLGDNTVYLE